MSETAAQKPKRPVSFWIAIVATSLVLYVLGSVPLEMAFLHVVNHLPPPVDDVGFFVYETAFAPLDWAAERFTWLNRFLIWYGGLFY